MVAPEYDDKLDHLGANGRYVFLTFSFPSRTFPVSFHVSAMASFPSPFRQFLYQQRFFDQQGRNVSRHFTLNGTDHTI